MPKKAPGQNTTPLGKPRRARTGLYIAAPVELSIGDKAMVLPAEAAAQSEHGVEGFELLTYEVVRADTLPAESSGVAFVRKE